MSFQLTEKEFLNRFGNADFTLKTQQQIVADFERSGIEAHYKLLQHGLALDELEHVVSEMVAEVIQLGEAKTLQLLYQIDIPQSTFLSLTTKPNFIQEISYRIIRREAQKVYLRSLF